MSVNLNWIDYTSQEAELVWQDLHHRNTGNALWEIKHSSSFDWLNMMKCKNYLKGSFTQQ